MPLTLGLLCKFEQQSGPLYTDHLILQAQEPWDSTPSLSRREDRQAGGRRMLPRRSLVFLRRTKGTISTCLINVIHSWAATQGLRTDKLSFLPASSADRNSCFPGSHTGITSGRVCSDRALVFPLMMLQALRSVTPWEGMKMQIPLRVNESGSFRDKCASFPFSLLKS